MGVYIKGMKMPSSCYDCNCNINDGVNYCCLIMQDIESDTIDPDCPLVEVPPHGRLIDADKLRASFKESIEECRVWANEIDNDTMMYARVSQSLGTFVEASLRVKAMPTVIESEE